MVDFRKHLQKQLGFISRSCQLYDKGFVDEAIRIALVARILFHNTRKSTSLVEHLGLSDIKMLTTCFPISKDTFHCIGLGMYQVGDGGAEYCPTLGDGPCNEFVTLDEWWDQVILVAGGYSLSRKNLVLNAVDKDGGAHVDSELTAEYEILFQEGLFGVIYFNDDGADKGVPIEEGHLVCLRQIGYEILNSGEISNI